MLGEHDLQKVPAAYRNMVGLEAYQNAMRELKELSRVHGFEVIVLQKNYGTAYMAEICRELEFARPASPSCVV